MITNNFLGGLGNQLFQIAAGFSHAQKIGTDFAINYSLGNCNSQSKKMFGQGHHPNRYKNNIYSKIPETKRNVFIPYEDPKFQYTPIPEINNLCLYGYFQSEKYFSDFSEKVKNLLVFPEKLKKKIDEKMSYSPKKKIGVHIRRGDYNNKINREVFADLGREYVLNAMKMFRDDNVDFLIFSDDFIKVNKELDISHFSNLNNSNEIEDLYALSQCDGAILSNSSFSWWGAWLGKKKYKVISPENWFGPKGPNDFEDIYRKDWIRIK